MRNLITFFLIVLTFLPIKAQNFVEVKTNIANLAIGGAVAWGDYDNDGNLDLFISGRDSLGHVYSKIYRNNNGVFTDIHANILGAFFGAIADWGDYDNDGDLDLLVSGADSTGKGQTKIYRNDNGVFTDIKAPLLGFRFLSSAKWGDYNGDGKLDIYLSGFSDEVGNYVTKIYKNDNGNFVDSGITLPATTDEKSTGWVDFDGDGKLDIYLPGRLGTTASLYKNNNGFFTKLSSNIKLINNSGSSDWCDFDNDGALDIAIMGIQSNYITSAMIEDSLPIAKIYRNVNNKFVDINAGLIGLSQGDIKWIDYDADGRPDIFITGMDRNGSLHSNLYRNDSGKFVLSPISFPGFNWANVAIGDFNNDNAPDIIVTGIDSLGNPVTKFFKNTIEKKLLVSSKFVCDTSKSIMISYVGDTSKIKNFYWDFDGGTVLKGSNNGPFKIKWDTIGEKNIQLILIHKSGVNDTLNTKISIFPGVHVSLGNDTTIENGKSITLNPVVYGGTMPFTYTWNGIQGDSDNTFVITRDSSILLKIQDKNNCIAHSEITVQVPVNNFSEQICLVTVDSGSGKNTVVWEKTPGKNIKEYKILKESAIGGLYSIIGDVPYSSEGNIPYSSTGIFIDQNSFPTQHAARYQLATIDSNDYQIGLSKFHQTMYLAINKGLPGTYNLIWTPYVGFDYSTYYIYKGSSPSNMELIDSIASTYNMLTDTAEGIAYYQIAVRKSSPCIISTLKADGEPISQSVSNLEDNLKFVNISSMKLVNPVKIFPNPFTDNLNIETIISIPSKVQIELFDIMGSKIYEYSTPALISGNFKHEILSGNLFQTSNILIMKIEVNGNVYYQKLIKK